MGVKTTMPDRLTLNGIKIECPHEITTELVGLIREAGMSVAYSQGPRLGAEQIDTVKVTHANHDVLQEILDSIQVRIPDWYADLDSL